MRSKINRFNAVLLIVMLTCSCCMDEQPGYDQAINPLWEYNFEVGQTSGIVPVIYQDRVIFSSAKEGRPDLSDNDKLIALDKTEGSLLWEWSDHIESRYENFDANSLKPIYTDVMALSIGSRNFAVNLLTGHTVWKNRNNASTSRSSLSNLGPKLFRTDIANNLHNERIMEGNFQTGTWKPIYEVDGGDSIRQGLQIPSFYFEPDGDTIMVFTNTLLKNYRDVIPYLISYNKTKKKEYYTVLLQDKTNGFTAVDWFPIIDGERVYIAVDDMLVCHNVLTGERIWKCQLNANLLFSGFILVNGRIYANSEGYGYLWCIDASTGNVIWKKETPGTSSPIQYYNNTLYFVGGSDGLLHIVDAGGGETLTLITAPTQFKNSNNFFSTRCTIDPETGKLYLVSQTTAYCYPPFR